MGKIKNIPHQFPDSVLAQIAEHSRSSVLFTVDADGNFHVFPNFNDSSEILGMSSFIEKWANGMEMMNHNNIIESMMGEDGDEEFPDE